MTRSSLPAFFTALALGSFANAQFVITTDGTSDQLVAFSPVDGTLISNNLFAITNSQTHSAIDVNGEIWVAEQLLDVIKRYDTAGNVLGQIGPSFPGGGIDNMRGMAVINGLVYVTNFGGNNGATPSSLVVFDVAGNHVTTLPLSASSSPFAVMPFQGDILVSSFAAGDDIHRYTLAGVSVGTFHDSTVLDATHQISPASDGSVWACGFTDGDVVKLDATTGNVLLSIVADGARGVYELQNGNVLWSNASGVWVYDIVSTTSTKVFTGVPGHLNLAFTNSAYNIAYGDGCFDFTDDRSNLFQLFANVQDAKPVLDGNALQFTKTANGYTATWLPGAAAGMYLAPSGTATIIANVSTGNATFTTSAPIPVVGGTTPSWTLSTEGILTAGATSNNASDTTPALADVDTPVGLAFYSWFTQNPTEAGSGKFKWEEVGGVLYVTADGVECAVGATVSPSTYQWQVNMTTGDVTMLWTSFTPAISTSDVLVGVTLANTSWEPVSETLSSMSGHVIDSNVITMVPMTLAAAPAPVITPSTNVIYTVTNVPELVPASGVYVSLLFFSLNPLPGGFDLTGILTTVPGCELYIATLDVNFSQISGSPVHNYSLTVSSPTFSPGDTYAAQAVGLFDGAFPQPNGEAGGFLLSNGVLSKAQ